MKKWFIFYFTSFFLCIFTLYAIDRLWDPFAIHTPIKKQRVENLTAEYAFLIQRKLQSSIKYYLVGTSRMSRFDMLQAEKGLNQRIASLGVSGSDISQWNLLLERIHANNANAIIGLDLFSLNRQYALSNNKSQINLQKALSNKSHLNINFYFLNSLYLQVIAKTIIKNIFSPRDQYFNSLDKEVYNDIIKTAPYKHFELWDMEIDKLIRKIRNTDIIIIFPEYYSYYCFYANMKIKETTLLDLYLNTIIKIILNSNAEIWIFLDINKITTNRFNFDANAWHFKPKVAKLILETIFDSKTKSNYGFLINKDNYKDQMARIRANISKTCNHYN